MYGLRDAPQIWQAEVTKAMTSIGFRACNTQPSVFSHDGRGLRCVVHVDDFLACGSRADLDWIFTELSKKFELKQQVLGPDKKRMSAPKALDKMKIKRIVRYLPEMFLMT